MSNNDRSVTYAHGRYYLDEKRAGGGGKPSLSREDRQKLVERHFEAAEFRQAYENVNLAAALKLSARLRTLKE